MVVFVACDVLQGFICRTALCVHIQFMFFYAAVIKKRVFFKCKKMHSMTEIIHKLRLIHQNTNLEVTAVL